MADRGVWNYGDLQSRYDRAQTLANDCTQDFAGNYFFPSYRAPKGYWTTTRRQVLDYVCDCPDFAFKIDQQIDNFAPSRWVRGDWSVFPDNRILVNRCIHCFAVAIAEREIDPRFPVNRQYQAKRSQFPVNDCGCGCGGSGDCGCPSKILGLPEPRLIGGCETECYVEPLTPRTLRTPSTTEGIPAYQTFQISEIQFSQTKFRSCSDRRITITLERNTSQGWNNATVSGLKDAIEFPFIPEYKTSSIEVDLTGNALGVYLLGITAIATGNFGENIEAELTIVDCSPLNPDLPLCEPDQFIEFGGGACEGSYLIANYTTGNVNPDGTCEVVKVRQFQEGLDCPFPEDPPPKECESLIPKNCPVISPSPPTCVNTGSGDGFNSNAGFNAIVRVQTGEKTIEYLRPDKKECAEECEFEFRSVNSPSCPQSPPKQPPAPFCPIPAKRYIKWVTVAAYLGSPAINGITTFDTFACDDGTQYVLLGYSAKCMPPVNRYLDSFAAANYQGNQFGEGCCKFDETKPPRPVCPVEPPTPPAITKWKCLAGVCSLDANGTYNSQAECEAALIPPPFTGGQCVGIAYRIQVAVTYSDGTFYAVLVNTNLGQSATPLSDATMLAGGKNCTGPIATVGFGTVLSNGKFVTVNGVENDGTSFGFAESRSFNTRPPLSISIYRVIRADGLPDTCGNLPSTCP
jgi:hypothetical protein